MDRRTLHVCLSRCPDSGRLLGMSDDIPGVFLETDTFDEMKEAIREVVPHLISHNLEIDESDLASVELLVLWSKDDVPASERENSAHKPRVFIEDVFQEAAE